MTPQQQIGHYRILSKLGEGGMGAVYRADDTRLHREVAIKVLPEHFRADAARMARFEREAQLLASLNHPHIAQIYGIEEGAIVMELVAGEELKGPVPIDTAIAYARQLADALEAAHEKGIVHRDLKPANIKITPDGVLKVLDFGLAKAAADEPAASSASPTVSPTLSLGMTQAGMILGTAAYMSPEQARGKTVDKRADIWAFGVVLYEMLTGEALFTGETVSDTLATVLTREPDFERVPARMRRLLRRCLEKDPRKRLRDIGDAWDLLDEPKEARTGTRGRFWPAAAALFALAAAVAGGVAWRAMRTSPQPLLRFSDDLGLETGSVGIALSRDGTRVAFVGADGRLYVRLLGNPRSVSLAGTENALRPFFSPNGEWVGFASAGQIKKVAVQGGTPIVLCEAANMLGASWGEDGHIVFSANNRSGLWRVADGGGKPEEITRLDTTRGEVTHRFPQILPGGKAVLFTIGTPGDYEDSTIEAHVFQTGQRKVIYRGGYHGRYLPSGHLLYIHNGTLFAAPMDARRLELTGPPVPILDDVESVPGSAAASFGLSETGTLAYVPAPNSALLSLGWVDDGGKIEPMNAPAKKYKLPLALSPDGTRLALVIEEDRVRNLWVYDWRRDRLFPVTFGKGEVTSATWFPDGKHLVFAAQGTGWGSAVYWTRADGGGQPEKLLDVISSLTASRLSVAPDGRRLAYSVPTGIQLVPVDLSQPEHPKAGSPAPLKLARALSAAFSPDGRLVAYVSDESGRAEVYVSSLEGAGGKWMVSSGGATRPEWAPNGKELFYQSATGQIMYVTYTASHDSFESDRPRVWLDRPLPLFNIALAPDGRRIAIALPPEGMSQKPSTHMMFLLNFFDELKRKTP
jgi:serine/threonine-protein kinase